MRLESNPTPLKGSTLKTRQPNLLAQEEHLDQLVKPSTVRYDITQIRVIKYHMLWYRFRQLSWPAFLCYPIACIAF